MKIVITGGAGYIGSKLVNYLLENTGHEIVVFDNFYWDQSILVGEVLSRVKFYREDVTAWSDNLVAHLEAADVIIPLAAYVGAPLCDSVGADLVDDLHVSWYYDLDNILKDQLVIYPNTNSGYGTVDGVCDENTPLNPISLYGETKQKGEEIVLGYKNSIVFRLATVFGWSFRPRIDLLVNNLVYDGINDNQISIFQGGANRNYIHVDDVVRAFSFAINNKESMRGQVYNLGNDSLNMNKLELGEKIANILNLPVVETTGNDPDKRDYLVSSKKLYDTSFNCTKSLDIGIIELAKKYKYYIKYAPLWLGDQRNY